jgi:hypothetical protein
MVLAIMPQPPLLSQIYSRHKLLITESITPEKVFFTPQALSLGDVSHVELLKWPGNAQHE